MSARKRSMARAGDWPVLCRNSRLKCRGLMLAALASSSTPLTWAERAYPRLTYFNKVDKGGHFAAWEEPQLFAQELRAAFRSLR